MLALVSLSKIISSHLILSHLISSYLISYNLDYPKMTNLHLLPPTNIKRADTTSSQSHPTGLDGCVVCPSTAAVCPKCPTGQVCNQLTRTCSTCPEFVCVKSDSAAGGVKPIGALVGGVVGGVSGVAVLAVIGFYLYYKLVYRKKNPRNANIEMSDDLDAFGGVEGKYQDSEGPNDRSLALRGGQTPRSHRLSSYESFMRPPRYNKRSGGSQSGSQPSLDRTTGGSRSYAPLELSKRNSIATTVSTSNASNILPIAYIPGVTIRPTKANTRSIYLYDVELLNSEGVGADAPSFMEHLIVLQGPTMTAVKAQPRLINVARIDEAEEPEELDDELELAHARLDPFAGLPKRELKLETLLETDGESDSDVDSDIGEIRRATSTRRNREIDEGQRIENQSDPSDEDTGSFVIPIIRE